jgi:esterase/lipase
MLIDQFYIQNQDESLCTLITECEQDIENFVFLIHGLTETKAEKEFMFTKISRSLATALPVRTVAFDLSGHGDSSGDLYRFSLNNWVEDTKAVIQSEVDSSNKEIKIHLIGAGVGNIIVLKVSRELELMGYCISSNILISPSENFKGFEKAISFKKHSLPEVISIEEYLNPQKEINKVDDSMLMFEPSPTYSNTRLHEYLIQLGCFSYDNIVAKVNKKLVEEVESFILNEYLEKKISTLVIEGTENEWLDKNSSIKNSIKKIPGDNRTLPNNPIRQQKIVETILEFYRKVMVKK